MQIVFQLVGFGMLTGLCYANQITNSVLFAYYVFFPLTSLRVLSSTFKLFFLFHRFLKKTKLNLNQTELNRTKPNINRTQTKAILVLIGLSFIKPKLTKPNRTQTEPETKPICPPLIYIMKFLYFREKIEEYIGDGLSHGRRKGSTSIFQFF